jgi:GNAT superfamily N-acetyltransferase
MQFEVRLARQSDAGDISSLIRGLGIFSRLEGEDQDATAKRVARHLAVCLADDSHTVFVATGEDSAVMAYAAVHWLPYLFLRGPEGYLSELFVSQPWRGRGVGTALLEAVVSAARDRGCARLMLEAVKQRDSYKRRFYPQRGWVEREDMANMVFEL